MRQKEDQRKGKETKGLGEFCEIAGKREKETKRGEDESGKRKKRRIRRRRRKMKERVPENSWTYGICPKQQSWKVLQTRKEKKEEEGRGREE